MKDNEELFGSDMMSCITEFVESKENLLKNIKGFKEKDKMLALCMESLERDLSKENREKFDKIIKLMYQVEEYYITLAYMLGIKYGKIVD